MVISLKKWKEWTKFLFLFLLFTLMFYQLFRFFSPFFQPVIPYKEPTGGAVKVFSQKGSFPSATSNEIKNRLILFFWLGE